MWRRKTVDELYEAGYAALEANDYKLALSIGQKLKRRRHTSAFEILARSYQGLEQPDKAIAALEEGVHIAPDVYLLWHQLGCYYSDNERFEDAHRAFDRARAVKAEPYYDAMLNDAVVYMREDKPDVAIRLLDDIPIENNDIPALIIHVNRVGALSDLDRFAEVISLCDKLLTDPEEFGALDEIDNAQARLGIDGISSSRYFASLFAHRGIAQWRWRGDERAALADAWQAVELDRASSDALWLIREVRNEKSASAKYIRLMLEGRYPAKLDPANDADQGCIIVYDVVADSVDEAMAMALQFERTEIRDSLRLDKSEILDPHSDDPKGVYRISPYHLFPLEE